MNPTSGKFQRTDALGTTVLTHRQRYLLAVVSIVGTLCMWEFATATGWVDQVLLPAPAEVVRTLVASLADGSLPKNVVASLMRVLEGFLLAIMVAVPLGVAMGVSRTVFGLVDPLLELLRPIPPIAVIPLTILWFGIGELSKALLIAYGAFFPILVNTMAGFREVERVHVHAAQVLGANRYHVFRDVVLRSALPFMIVGARLGMGMAFIVLVAAELIASSAGLGFMINDARYNFRTDQMFVGMACIGILGFALNTLLLTTERRLLKWKNTS
jgi:ABC-type nitrate/sulfonate/bicarbonate transport system permease component